MGTCAVANWMLTVSEMPRTLIIAVALLVLVSAAQARPGWPSWRPGFWRRDSSAYAPPPPPPPPALPAYPVEEPSYPNYEVRELPVPYGIQLLPSSLTLVLPKTPEGHPVQSPLSPSY